MSPMSHKSAFSPVQMPAGAQPTVGPATPAVHSFPIAEAGKAVGMSGSNDRDSMLFSAATSEGSHIGGGVYDVRSSVSVMYVENP